MEKVRDRESTIFSYAGIVAAILLAGFAFFGVKTFRDLRQRIQDRIVEDIREEGVVAEKVRSAVISQVTGELERRLATLSDEMALGRLSNLAHRLEQGDGFTHSERDVAVSSITQLQQNELIRNRPEFSASVEKILDAFAKAGIWQYVDDIDDSLSDLTTSSPGIAMTLIQHYGRRHIGSIECDDDLAKRTRKYQMACKKAKLNSLALGIQLGVEERFQADGYDERCKEIVRDISLLDDEHKTAALMLIKQYSDAHMLARVPSGEDHRIADAYSNVLAKYGEEMFGNMEHEISVDSDLLRPLSEGELGDDALALLQSLRRMDQ